MIVVYGVGKVSVLYGMFMGFKILNTVLGVELKK